MTTITTTEAAIQAGVTVATIRTWCRRNAISAAKQAGRWVIDTASLAHRITIGQRKAPVTIPIHVTSRTTTIPGQPGAVGPEAVLRTAFEAGTQITLGGRWEGERVYLGRERQTYGDHGITLERVGLDRHIGQVAKLPGVEVAVYLIDTSRLEGAPLLAAQVAETETKRLAAYVAAEQRAQDEEDRYLNSEVH